MPLLVDDSIINSPFEEPSRYRDYGEGQLTEASFGKLGLEHSEAARE